MWGHSENTVIYEPGIGPLPYIKSAGAFPASRTIIWSKFLLFISNPAHDILLKQPEWTKIHEKSSSLIQHLILVKWPGSVTSLIEYYHIVNI
jgi:hypothetical protein